MEALAGFFTSYKEFDKAISDFSVSVFSSNLEGESNTDDLERKVDEALIGLEKKAGARISSLTKHDAEAMSITREIGDLSGKELDTLKTYRRAVADKNADLSRLIKELGDLTSKRQTAYARLLGLKD